MLQRAAWHDPTTPLTCFTQVRRVSKTMDLSILDQKEDKFKEASLLSSFSTNRCSSTGFSWTTTQQITVVRSRVEGTNRTYWKLTIKGGHLGSQLIQKELFPLVCHLQLWVSCFELFLEFLHLICFFHKLGTQKPYRFNFWVAVKRHKLRRISSFGITGPSRWSWSSWYLGAEIGSKFQQLIGLLWVLDSSYCLVLGGYSYRK